MAPEVSLAVCNFRARLISSAVCHRLHLLLLVPGVLELAPIQFQAAWWVVPSAHQISKAPVQCCQGRSLVWLRFPRSCSNKTLNSETLEPGLVSYFY